mmetsp:Transcript_28758/g.77419  ORF Transcript_28758/g.77419 Transcript_28758/m.77419 type:complete len:222 (-) Transcript_28758:174-839(-)
MHAQQSADIELRAVAISDETKYGSDNGLAFTEVKPEARRVKLEEALQGVDILNVNLAAADAGSKLESAFRGCSAVVAAPGSRQPGLANTCELGARIIVGAMKTAGVERLVVLSSMGVGNDFIPAGFAKYLMKVMMVTYMAQPKRDLVAMEQVVRDSNLDYVIVRPMGVDPDELPQGKWRVIDAPVKRAPPLTVAKEDVAQYVLTEALSRAHSQAAVTVGKP